MSNSELFAPKRGSARWLGWAIGGVVILLAVLFPFLVDRPRFWLPNIGVKSIWLGTL